MNDSIKLFPLYLKVKKREVVEYGRVVSRYYKNKQFCKNDLKILSKYLFYSPYRISKRFLLERGDEEIYTYGETPITTMAAIAEECGITAEDTVMDLGCGRGRTLFWLNDNIGCKAIGVDFNPMFIDKANAVNTSRDVNFICQDMLDVDFSQATVIYLYGTCLDDDYIMKLINKLSSLPSDTKVITVSYSLTEYDAPFTLVKSFNLPYTWGVSDIYLHVI